MTEFNDDQMYLYPDPDRDHLHIVGELSLDCEIPVNDSDSYFVPVIADIGRVGPKGQVGEPAGFGSVNATVDQTTGTPSVTVTSSGPDTAKNFNFAFSHLKGEPFEFEDFTTSQLDILRANIVSLETFRYRLIYSDFIHTGSISYHDFTGDFVQEIIVDPPYVVPVTFVFLCFKNGLILQESLDYMLMAALGDEHKVTKWSLMFNSGQHSLPVQGDIYDVIVIKLKEAENQGD